jgi:hypothetical protein
MPEIKQSDSRPKKRWLKWLAWCLAVFVVALVALYFVVTSSAFFKSVVLPRVGTALNADVTVSDAEISPFSQVVLHDLKVTPKGGEPILTATSVTTRYSLISIIRGRILVGEATVVAPTVVVIENADGSSNLDPLLNTAKQKAPQKSVSPPSAKPSESPTLDVRSVSLKNATVRYVKNLKDGGQQTLQLTNLNIAVGNIKNGEAGRLDFATAIAMEKTLPAPGSNTAIQAKVNGAFTFNLTQDLKTGAVKGSSVVNVDQASGDFADLTTLAATFDCDVTPSDIKQCALAFTKAGAALGEVSVSGPFDLAKLEGKLKVEVTSLDHQVLNLVGDAAGIDFGTTTVNTSNDIELSRGGAVITAAGTVNVARFEVKRQNQTSPTIDLRCEYNFSVNRPEQSVQVKTLKLTGTQDQRSLLQAELTSPMTIAWGDTGNAVGDATLNVAVTGLNLGDWKAFAGNYAPSGVANLKLKLESQQAGKQLTFDFDGQVDQLSARVGNDQIPPVDVRLTARGTATDLKQFSLSQYHLELAQQRQSVLAVSGAGTFDRVTQDADVQVTAQATLDRLSALLAHWVTAAGDYAPVGTANVKLKLQAQKGGKQLAFDVDGQVDQLSAHVGKNRVMPVDVHLVTRGTATDLKQFNLSQCRLDLTQQGQSVLAVSSTGTFDRATLDSDMEVTAQAALDRLAMLLPQANVTCSAGTLELTSHLARKQQTQTVTGHLALADFTGGYGDYELTNFGTSIDLDLLLKGKQLEIRKAMGQLRQGQTAGGKFDVAGNYDLDKKTGQLTAELTDFTQNDLGPFLQPSFGDKKLVTVSLNTTASAGFDAGGNGAIKADLHLGNLVVQDPKNQLPSTPLEVRLQIDAAASNKVAVVRQCELALTPTERAKNELRFSGTVDYSKSNAITGNVKLAADSLDVTPYYDLLAKNKTGAAKSSGQPSSGKSTAVSASSEPQQEPAAMTLPVSNLTCDVNIGRLYLRQVDVSNLVATARFDGGHVVVKPCQFALNGAPVNATADLDLGVPGYKYDIAFNANKVPLKPLVNSFSPTYSDKAQGDLIANIQIKGAGVTGRNLQKNLTGQANLSLTNANIQIVGSKVKAVLTPIALVLGAPELLSSPLDYVTAELQLGDGKIETRKFVAHSAAFLAESQGTIPMAEVLMSSPLNQPVDIALAQGVGGKLGLANLPAEGSYTKLPTFVHLTGTLGDPSAKTDKAVIAGLTARSIGGAVGGQAGSLLQGIGGLLSGQPAAGTNAPSGNQPILPNPLDLFRQPRRR